MKNNMHFTVSQKHKLLYGNQSSSEELVSMGDTCMEDGILHDALEFYSAAQDRASLKKLAEEAVSNADLLLFINVYKALQEAPSVEQAEKLKANAIEMGKTVEAGRVETLFLSGSEKK